MWFVLGFLAGFLMTFVLTVMAGVSAMFRERQRVRDAADQADAVTKRQIALYNAGKLELEDIRA